jgi:hypothetical protein
METEKERKALLARLNLLADMMKRHEWTVFGLNEAEDIEKTEAKIDSEASNSAPEKPEGE